MARIISYKKLRSGLITEAEHRAVLQRFDVKKATLGLSGIYWEILKECAFCNKYFCPGCPFQVFCENHDIFLPLKLGTILIWWNVNNDEEARKKLKQIRVVLLRAKKVPYVRSKK